MTTTATKPQAVRFEILVPQQTMYVNKGTNTPAYVKGETHLPNVYKKVVKVNKKVGGEDMEVDELKTFRYIDGCKTIDYEEQLTLKYPTLAEDAKSLQKPNIIFLKNYKYVDPTLEPTLYEFLKNAPYEKLNAKECGVTPEFEMIQPDKKATEKLKIYEDKDKAIELINKIFKKEDSTMFDMVCAHFRIDTNSPRSEKKLLLREKAESAPDLVINAIAGINNSNEELVSFGSQMGLLIQTKTGFTDKTGTKIKDWKLNEVKDANWVRKEFGKWLSTQEGETYRQWLQRELKDNAEKQNAELMNAE